MARKSFGANPLSLPQPVFIIASYGADDVPCAMNAAWCGISEMTEVSMCLSANHKTTENIMARGAFTISMGTAPYVAACDFFGLVSGKIVKDKLGTVGFTVTKSDRVDAPIINELPICLECKLIDYDKKTCLMRGEIVNVSVDESALTDGAVDLAKVQPLTFDPFNKAYHVVGDKVADAWDAGKKYM